MRHGELMISTHLLLKIFEKYAKDSKTIKKDTIEKILEILSIELYHPLEFIFEKQEVTYKDVTSSIIQNFSTYILISRIFWAFKSFSHRSLCFQKKMNFLIDMTGIFHYIQMNIIISMRLI